MTLPPIKHRSLGHSRTEFTVTIAEEKRSQAEAAALAKLGEKMNVPGFRPGKIPSEVVREKAGDASILDATLDLLLPTIVTDLLTEHKLIPVVPPKVAVTSREPLTITVLIAEKPDVKLKHADRIKAEKSEVTVAEKDIDDFLVKMLKPMGITEVTEEIAKEKLGMPSVEVLRKNVREALEHDAKDKEQRRREKVLLDSLEAAVQAEIADELLEHEERLLLEELGQSLKRAEMSFEGWLKQSSLTPETFKQDLRKKATRRWKLRLGMEQLIEELSINIPDPEVDQRMQAMLNSVPPEQYSEAKERMADPETRMSLKWQMTMEKLMETLLAR